MKLAPVSNRLGHTKVAYSVKDYLAPHAYLISLEVEFVCDLFTLGTEEIIGKWYRGHDEAERLLSRLQDLTRKPN